MQTDDILQSLYDSEINYTILTFWDKGFHGALGDKYNGTLDAGWCASFYDAVQMLARHAANRYPNSCFATRWMTE